MGAFATTNAQKCRSAHYADLTLACLYPLAASLFSVQQSASPETPHLRRKFFRGVTGDRFKFIASF